MINIKRLKQRIEGGERIPAAEYRSYLEQMREGREAAAQLALGSKKKAKRKDG